MLTLFADTAFAAAVTSTWNTTTGTWNVDANWTSVPHPDLYPDNGHGGVATFAAVISAGGPAYIVTLNTNITVESLLLNSASATVNINGTINNAGSTLTLNTATGSWTLNGGTLSGGTLAFANAQTLIFAASNGNLLTGVTVNGDLTFSATAARTRIAGGTTFTTAHLAGNSTEFGFAPGSTLTGTILFEGASAGNRYVDMDNNADTFTVGPTGVIRTETGAGGDGFIGLGNNFGGAMTLVNQGLISSQVSGRTLALTPRASPTAAHFPPATAAS